MNNGWIKIHRKSLQSSIWENPIIWFIWCWCLLKANHKDNKFPFNGKDILIKNGSFITGRTKALKELPTISVQNYKTAINYLKSTSRITTQVTNRFTIITIVKWEDYQHLGSKVTNQVTSQVNNHQPATNQPLTTNKNEKNEKNEKNKKNNILSAKADAKEKDKNSFNQKPLLKKLETNKQKHFNIIALYFISKEFNFKSFPDYDDNFKRALKPASKLVPYSVSDLSGCMHWLNENADYDWTLESVCKEVDDWKLLKS